MLLQIVSIVAACTVDLAASDELVVDYYPEDGDRADSWNYYYHVDTSPMAKPTTISWAEKSLHSLRAPTTDPLKVKRENDPEQNEFLRKLIERRNQVTKCNASTDRSPRQYTASFARRAGEESAIITTLTTKKIEPMQQPPKIEPIEQPKKIEPIEQPKRTEPMQQPKKIEPTEEPKTTEPITEPKKTEPSSDATTTLCELEDETNATTTEGRDGEEGDMDDMIFGPYGIFGKRGPNAHLFADGQIYGKGGLYGPENTNYSMGMFRGQSWIGPDGKRHALKFPPLCYSTRCNDTYIKQMFTKHHYTGSTDPCGLHLMGRKKKTTTRFGTTISSKNATRMAPMKICVHPNRTHFRIPCRTQEELDRLSRLYGYNVTDLTVCVRNYTEFKKPRYKHGTFFEATFVKCWTTTKSRPLALDLEKLLGIISNLTYEYDMNLTNNLNDTLLNKWRVPTCGPTAQTRPTYYEIGSNETIVAKCFFCGMEEEGIPVGADCADAFAGDFIPLLPVNARARGQMTKFRKYCRRKNIARWYISPAEPRSVYGRWTGGCSVRWIDLSGVYTQRSCRNRKRAAMGMHLISKRMAKLEMALSMLDNGCISSPMAVLVPFSRGISLYARFHACVCTGNWCNGAYRIKGWKLISFLIVNFLSRNLRQPV